jgi:hypothetical protein
MWLVEYSVTQRAWHIQTLTDATLGNFKMIMVSRAGGKRGISDFLPVAFADTHVEAVDKMSEMQKIIK